jgi:molybdate/tungstate transport system substrate-binding protein
MKYRVQLILLLVLAFFSGSCGSKKKSERLVIFHAGSLSYPIREISAAYMREHPGVEIISEAAGSVASIRKITELNRQADIIASADYHLIDHLLRPSHTGHNIRFATNRMVIAFNDRSNYGKEINAGNWPEILVKPEVRIGSSDPDADPCGYRTLLSLRLEELRSNQDSLVEKILSGSRHFLRPKETDLIALLETGTIDYMFIYESVAKQQQMSYVRLNDSINLSDPDLAGWYAQSKVIIRGSEPGSKLEIRGEPITYGISVLNHSPNPGLAWDFTAWLLNPEKGGKIINSGGQQPIHPALADDTTGIPEQLITFIKKQNNHH